MHFTIKPEGDNALPVVAELPADQIGRLEGYNGVGKTLVATVLQLCTGTQPLISRDEQSRWEGLRLGLGRMSVTGSDLRDNHKIRWRFDSRLWPADIAKAGDIDDDWFEVTIDGEEGTLAEVRELLIVERIAGTEGLLETLADEADLERVKVDRFITRTADRRQELEQFISKLGDYLRPIQPGAYADQLARLGKIEKDRAQAESELTAANERLRALQSAAEKREQLAELRNIGPDLEAQLAETVKQIEDRQGRTAEVLKRINELSPKAAESAQATEALVRANQSLKRANTRLSNASAALAEATAEAGISDAAEAEATLESVDQTLTDAEKRRKGLTTRPEVIELLTSLDGPLRLAQNRELGEQIMLIDPQTPGREWTIDEVYEAVGQRRERVQEAPTAPPVDAIEREIETLRARATALKRVPGLRTNLDRAQRSVRTANENVKNLNDQAQNPASGEIKALQDSLDDVNEELIALGAEQARLERRRQDLAQGHTAEEFELAVEDALDRLGIIADQLGAAIDEGLGSVQGYQAAFAEVDAEFRRETAQLSSLSEQINRLVVGLHNRPDFEWLVSGGNTPSTPSPDDPFETKVHRLESLANAVVSADRAMENVSQTPQAVSYALDRVALQLRGASGETPPLVPVMRGWLSRVAASWFDENAVRSFVLPDAEGSVTVDLDDRMVRGHHQDGTPISKPLEGFSSGEQAFAFTQAQLALLDHRSQQVAAQRLVILDEFGAFIAVKGRQQLGQQLRHWAAEHPDDQIVVILPATQNYRAMAASTGGERHAELLAYADALEENEYFVGPYED